MKNHALIQTDHLAKIIYKECVSDTKCVELNDETCGEHLLIILGNTLARDKEVINKIIEKTEGYDQVEFAPFSLRNTQDLYNHIHVLKNKNIKIAVRDPISFASIKQLGLRNVSHLHDMILTRAKKLAKPLEYKEGACSIFYEDREFEEETQPIAYFSLDTFDKIIEVLTRHKTIHTDHIELAMLATIFGNDVKLYEDSFGFNLEIYKQSLCRYRNVEIVKNSYKISITSKEVSVICACMNRRDILKLNLRSWLNYEEIAEIIIVDWSSDESLESLTCYDDRIHVIRVQDQTHFNISKAYNLALDYATQPFVLKMDVDYMLNPYYNFFIEHPKPQNRFFYAGEWTKNPKDNTLRYLAGLCYARREDLVDVGGYNENFEGYGYDDSDLYDRLRLQGLHKHDLQYNHCVLHIPHPDSERIKNYKNKSMASTGSINKQRGRSFFSRGAYHVLKKEPRYTVVTYESADTDL